MTTTITTRRTGDQRTRRAPTYDGPAMGRLRISPRAYRQVTLAAAILLALIIVTGAAVRLTGSGLGCPEWPNCTKGHLTAGASDDIHAKVEFANRVVTGLVSVGVILAVLGSLVRLPRRKDLVWLSLGLVVGVIAQALLGALVVEELLDPPFVMGHFLLSAVLLADAIVLYHRAELPDDCAAIPLRSADDDVAPPTARAERVGGARDRNRGHRRGSALRRRGIARQPQSDPPRPRGARGRAHPRHERHGLPRLTLVTLWVVSREPGTRRVMQRCRSCWSSSSPRARSATRSTSTACPCWSASTWPAPPRSSAPPAVLLAMYEPCAPAPAWRRPGVDDGPMATDDTAAATDPRPRQLPQAPATPPGPFPGV